MPADAAGQRVALVAAATSGFLTPFMGSAVTIALPAIAAEFRLGAVSLGWVTSAFLLAAAALLCRSGASPTSSGDDASSSPGWSCSP